ncbi:acyl-CoA dehydrogenase family protein [Saccharopolyspora sp. 5N708]|uniref:acyl-CoA dehydrogenase family protein n=1 Tax=Saccharopolyspora sp. 5N708 TaxID=3457424 RepID=UPI003FD43E3C
MTDVMPTLPELLARANALRPELWAAAPETDRNRRLSDATYARVRAAGLLKLGTPRLLGGYEASLRTMVEVTEALGRGCGATGWVIGVLNTGNWLAAQYPAEARAEVWGSDPDAAVASVATPSATVEQVDGGLRVNGEWAYASGSLHADWVSVAVPLDANDKSTIGMVLVPASDIKVDDTWHVTGMRGTGSNTVVLDEVVVPQHRVLDAHALFSGENAHGHPDEPLYRANMATVFGLSLIGTQLGQAYAALEHVLAKAPTRVIATTRYPNQARSVPFQVDVAEAETKIRAARLQALEAADTADSLAAEGEAPDVDTRTSIRLALTWASKQCWEAVDQLVTAHGTSSFAEVNPLQRIWRDQAVATRHVAFNLRLVEEIRGKSLLGLDPREVTDLV